MQQPRLRFLDIWNMCFGFFGIQIGFELQATNTSRIFQTLGADIGALPILWIAAPLTGLLVQPIVGHFSDKTWTPLGRRRPYFLVGAILASAALIVMPNSPYLWFAAGMLWIKDAALNITMEPFRAFVADNLPDSQRSRGYALQSFFIGSGAVVASALPWVFTNWFGIANTAPAGEIPPSVHVAYYVGGATLLFAVSWTVFSTREYSPEEMARFEAARAAALGLAPAGERTRRRAADAFFRGGAKWIAAGVVVAAIVAFARQNPRPAFMESWPQVQPQLYVLAGLIAAVGVIQVIAGAMRARSAVADNGFLEVVEDLLGMPATMRQLAWVQFFSWFALFAMWIYATPALATHHFSAPDPASQGYQNAGDWWGVLSAVRNGVAALAALAILWIANRVDRRRLHAVNLTIGAVGFASMLLIREPGLLWVSMVGVGVAWASIVALPYAMLAGAVPAGKMGVYMGIFNIFIVVPQLVAATVLGFLLQSLFAGDPIWAMALAASSFLLAAAATLRVQEGPQLSPAQHAAA